MTKDKKKEKERNKKERQRTDMIKRHKNTKKKLKVAQRSSGKKEMTYTSLPELTTAQCSLHSMVV